MYPEGRENRKELGGVEEGYTIIRIYYMRKEFIFNRRKKGKNVIMFTGHLYDRICQFSRVYIAKYYVYIFSKIK